MAGRFPAQVKSSLPGSTPSVIACGDATFPKGTAFRGGDKVSGSALRRPLGGAGARSETEGGGQPGSTPSVIACGDATFPKGTALVVAIKFSAQPKGVPLGELASVARLRG